MFYKFYANQPRAILNPKNSPSFMKNLSEFPRIRGFHFTFHVQFSSLNFNETLLLEPRCLSNLGRTSDSPSDLKNLNSSISHLNNTMHCNVNTINSFIPAAINKCWQHWNKFFPLPIFYLLFYQNLIFYFFQIR